MLQKDVDVIRRTGRAERCGDLHGLSLAAHQHPQQRTANPNSYRLHQILADNYVSIHRKADAIAEYRKTLEMQPAVSGVRYELARLVPDTQIEEAIPLLKREIEMNPEHYLASTLLGRVYVILRRPDEAMP